MHCSFSNVSRSSLSFTLIIEIMMGLWYCTKLSSETDWQLCVCASEISLYSSIDIDEWWCKQKQKANKQIASLQYIGSFSLPPPLSLSAAIFKTKQGEVGIKSRAGVLINWGVFFALISKIRTHASKHAQKLILNKNIPTSPWPWFLLTVTLHWRLLTISIFFADCIDANGFNELLMIQSLSWYLMDPFSSFIHSFIPVVVNFLHGPRLMSPTRLLSFSYISLASYY